MYIIVPTEETLSKENISFIVELIAINSIFSPLLSYFEPSVYLGRRGHAPYAPNFTKMKSFFAGQVTDLGELYAESSQTLFVAIFYISILPTVSGL
jgi:hypothetical protein